MHQVVKHQSHSSIPALPVQQCAAFVGLLFEPSDIIVVRAIESGKENGKKTSRVIGRYWLTGRELLCNSVQRRLQLLNQQQNANIYFGVNPRSTHGSNEVVTVRCLWADLDNVLPEDALACLTSPFVLPMPSIVVNSGRGVHLYWKLGDALEIRTPEARQSLEGLLRNLYTAIGGDSVQNVERILRLPGFENKKDARNGTAPTPCTLYAYNEEKYPHSAFARWTHKVEKAAPPSVGVSKLCGPRSVRLQRRIDGLIRHLDIAVEDRSRRDFAVVAGLLRLGLPADEIKELVAQHSKFCDQPDYVNTTIKNAVRANS